MDIIGIIVENNTTGQEMKSLNRMAIKYLELYQKVICQQKAKWLKLLSICYNRNMILQKLKLTYKKI